MNVHLPRMKKAGAILLLTIVLLQCNMKSAIYAYYRVNKEFIAASLCENKAKPSLHCEGKCYLSKKIQAEEKRERSIPSLVKNFEGFVLFCCSASIDALPVPYNEANLFNPSCFLIAYNASFGSIFQPPRS